MSAVPANVPTAPRRLDRLWASWPARWPLWLGTLGAVWLALSLSIGSPDYWVKRLRRENAYQTLLDRQIDQLTQNRSQNNRVDSNGRKNNVAHLMGRKAGALTGTLLKFGLLVGLPYALLLGAIGYYLYWHFARKTLFGPDWPGRLAFGLTLAGVWVLWNVFVDLGTSISPATAKAAFGSTLPPLTLAFWLGQCVVMHVVIRRREDRQLAQAAREAELAALTAQVNPPFIFHALQHLRTAAHTEHLPRTGQSLAQLAGIMQYVLEESRKQLTDVSREIDFIRDYLRLQQLRLPQQDNIQISTDIDWDGKPALIVPLLLNPLVENAFKYGISIQQACFVRIQLRVANGVLTFVSENSVLPRTDLDRGTGLGLANVRKRLRLAYPEQHKLTVREQAHTYRVELTINLP